VLSVVPITRAFGGDAACVDAAPSSITAATLARRLGLMNYPP
jgi:hypothetical protein